VVDNEQEPCGCPAPVSVATAGTSSDKPADVGAKVGGPSSTPADTAFPLAVSQGLAPPPAKPDVPAGEVHASVTVPLTYNGATGKAGDPADLAVAGAAGVTPAAPAAAAPTPKPAANPAPIAETATAVAPQKKPQKSGFFHSVGRFFSKIFGS
jgi:hypothetical protein